MRDRWDRAGRQAVRERLRRDMARRDQLTRRQRSALDGVVHALKPDSMDRSLPARHLLSYDLGSRLRPAVAAVAAGEPEGATHLTWQVSGMGIAADTALWGAAREAAQLAAAQHEAGAERPCVIAWLGYRPPSPWGALSGRRSLSGGARLAHHLRGWAEHLRSTAVTCTAAVRPHLAIEAHSYGTLVAVHALQILRRRPPGGSPFSVDALVVSGPVGLPADLAGAPAAVGLEPEQVFLALSRTDYLAALGRRLSGRRRWTGITRLDLGPDEARRLGGAVGHNTSRFRPDAGWLARGFGYRDVGSTSLYRIARATAGLPVD